MGNAFKLILYLILWLFLFTTIVVIASLLESLTYSLFPHTSDGDMIWSEYQYNTSSGFSQIESARVSKQR